MDTYLIVDLASIVGRFMHLTDEEYGEDHIIDGKKWHIPSVETSLERVETSFQRVLDQIGVGPEQIIAVCEPESPGEARKRKFPDYKAKREKRPKEFYLVLNELVVQTREMLMRYGAICATPRVIPTVEGDDLVAELARRLPGRTVIWTSDKDLLAAEATDHLIWNELNPMKYPVPNHLIRLYRSIVTGDVSDNIPGCKGFGEKAWEKMFELIGPDGVSELDKMVAEKRLHELQEDVGSFKPFKMLIDQADAIYLSYELMGFEKVPAHRIKWEARVTDCEQTLVTADNFDQALQDVRAALISATHAVIDFETDTPLESDAWKETTKDDEGKGGIMVDVIASEIAGMGLKGGTSCWYFSVDHAETSNIKLSDLEKVVSLLKDKTVYAHNSTGFENVVLWNSFGYLLEGMIDTKLMASYVNENDKQGLKYLSKRDLGYDQTSYDEVLAGRRGMRNVTGEEVLAYGIDDCITCDSLQNLYTTIMHYEGTYQTFMEIEKDSAFFTSLAFVNGVAFDADVHKKLKEENDANITRARAELETLLLKVGFGEHSPTPIPALITKGVISQLYETVTGKPFVSRARTVKGCLLDIDHPEILEAVQLDFEAGAMAPPARMNELYMKHWKPRADINVRSPKQVAKLLYDVLEAPVRIRNMATDTMRAKGNYEGNPSTDDEAIANAIAFNDVSEDGAACLKKLEEYKGYLTRESLFLSKYPRFVHWKTGKMHPSMMQCGTTTRRFSHSAPNLAQLPKKKGKEVRNMLVADPEFVLGAYDFDSQELKLQAEDCKCEQFMSCYIGEVKKDVHAKTGYQVAIMQGVDPGEYESFEKAAGEDGNPMKPFRASGKATNFSTSYLCKKKRLANMLAITEEMAEAFMEAKALAFPGLLPHVDRYTTLCAKRKYSLSFMGARRHLARSYQLARTEGERESVDRLAWSFRIQGSGAEQIKLAMSRAWRTGIFKTGDCWPVTIIHDEKVVQFRKSKLPELAKVIHDCVCGSYANMVIPASSTPKIGTHFGSVKEWDVEQGKLKEK